MASPKYVLQFFSLISDSLGGVTSIVSYSVGHNKKAIKLNQQHDKNNQDDVLWHAEKS